MGIDTPGLQDTYDNNQKINLIKSLLTKYPFIRTILIVKKYDEVRFLPCFQECLEVFMEAFPLPNFWDHVIIVNTRANPNDGTFQDFLDNKPPSFLENLLICDNLVKLMKEKNISIPKKIQEYYVESKRYKEIPKVLEEFEKIKFDIQNTPMMFKNIFEGKKNLIEFKKEDEHFKYYEIYDELICIDFNDKKHVIKYNYREGGRKFRI